MAFSRLISRFLRDLNCGYSETESVPKTKLIVRKQIVWHDSRVVKATGCESGDRRFETPQGNFFAPKNNLLWNKLVSFIGGGDNYYQLTSVSFSICILRHASLFRSYSGNLPAMFLRSVHTFSWFLKSNWSGDFGHAETGNGAKKRVVLRREIFSL